MTVLRERYRALLFDLDGTLFRGRTAVPGAVAALSDAATAGCQIGYLTNNGSRSGPQVVEHLRELGFAATVREVITSGQAAARVLAQRLAPGCSVLVVGTESLAAEVTGAGLRVTRRAEDADAVVQGHSPDTAWPVLAEACLAIRAGALWVACNIDATLPDERGVLPGNGSMVAALERATDRHPVVAGKPEPALFHEAVARTGIREALAVGDRLDTDILGAYRAGLPSLLVLTGVSDAAALLAAPEEQRPTYIGADLGALRADPQGLRPAGDPRWSVRPDGATLRLGDGDGEGDGGGDGDGGASPEGDPVGALRALCAVHWERRGGPVTVRADGGRAAEALRALGLGDGPDSAAAADKAAATDGRETAGDAGAGGGLDAGRAAHRPVG
ncbi:MAG TPA: HAD-IIA family hydrolase [Pseudonocardia sp.]